MHPSKVEAMDPSYDLFFPNSVGVTVITPIKKRVAIDWKS